ncbi:BQ2448_3889 [Microbotryum intermedium]|uniref:BQ2448_3889 protein n=1 Tax=Microbotryum intermedium TaxID=269621 RepID=A0A238FEV6_9BASI|nr:BQ2448_3889 [Microbotryum intermedium]
MRCHIINQVGKHTYRDQKAEVAALMRRLITDNPKVVGPSRKPAIRAREALTKRASDWWTRPPGALFGWCRRTKTKYTTARGKLNETGQGLKSVAELGTIRDPQIKQNYAYSLCF